MNVQEMLDRGYRVVTYRSVTEPNAFNVLFHRREIQQIIGPNGEPWLVSKSTKLVVTAGSELPPRMVRRHPSDMLISDEAFAEMATREVGKSLH
jgi:hypothetical protein